MLTQKNQVLKAVFAFLKLELQTFIFTIMPILLFATICYMLFGPFCSRLESVWEKLYDFLKWNEWLLFSVLLISFAAATVVTGTISLMVFKSDRFRLYFNAFVLIVLFAVFSSFIIVHLNKLCYI